MGGGELEDPCILGALAVCIFVAVVRPASWGSRAVACTDMTRSPLVCCILVGLQAPNAVGQAAEDEWVRFTATDDSIGVLETGVQLQMVPAEPAGWKLEWVCSWQQRGNWLGVFAA